MNLFDFIKKTIPLAKKETRNNASSFFKKSIGYQAEKAAGKFLKRHGLKLIESNYFCKSGEIDLIMKEKATLVFIEVRLRNNPRYISGIESVTREKQKKVILTAQHYLQHKKLTHKISYRFDIIGAIQKENQFEFEWIKNAFH